MNGLFSPDGTFGRVLNGFTDLLTLSILWAVCSLPFVTAGASAAALYTMTLRIVRGEEGRITAGFFRAFRDNFKNASIIHLLMTLLAALLTVYWISVGILPAAVRPFFRGASILFWMLWLMEALFVYAVQARFENTPRNIMKNAWLMAAGSFPYFILVLLISGIPVWTFWLNPRLFVMLLPVWVFLGPGVTAWLNSLVFHRCFRRFIPEEEDTEEE